MLGSLQSTILPRCPVHRAQGVDRWCDSGMTEVNMKDEHYLLVNRNTSLKRQMLFLCNFDRVYVILTLGTKILHTYKSVS